MPLNLLRHLGNQLRIPLVAIGTREAQIAPRSDDQLENRFEPLALPLWRNDADFARLLASLMATLPLREPSGLADDADLRAHILHHSGGMIGEVAAMLNAAARQALATGLPNGPAGPCSTLRATAALPSAGRPSRRRCGAARE